MKFLIPLLPLFFGALILRFSIIDHDGFFETRKAKRLVRIIGRKAARIVYMIMGAVLVGASLVMIAGSFLGLTEM